MRAEKVWSLVETVNNSRIYQVGDQYVVTKSSYDKSYGYNHTQTTFGTYTDAVIEAGC